VSEVFPHRRAGPWLARSPDAILERPGKARLIRNRSTALELLDAPRDRDRGANRVEGLGGRGGKRGEGGGGRGGGSASGEEGSVKIVRNRSTAFEHLQALEHVQALADEPQGGRAGRASAPSPGRRTDTRSRGGGRGG